MAPKFSRASDLSQRSSILVQDVGPDDLDLGDCWNGHAVRPAPRWRIAYAEKKTRSGPTWGSRFVSLSSNVRNAGAAITTRAKQVRIPTSTRFSLSRLCKPTALSRAASMPTQRVLKESDFDDCDGQPEPEDDSYGSETGKKHSKLHSSHSWTQGSS
ncbi:hypothetical protein F442_07085 [Phytophthora nicotianae P10297]|uniref:Uncharacterized protein n=4 Tax=Phytophthora nicotianae TaxID=4792 RepID=W2QD96_PHYN3|nr:hypothetical protein PPTG_10109 [Phytophthora nicotianae INRA-310]ETO77764.1 hypothetical protein F444_07089 [Phytophthora nicotianae P1976]ETP46713.1 hypothetical protein F442_07085 [Phytophthora nicotianae P10297]KUF75795.1 hypothetical protein AM587_10016569 [Phytophthora nicotianae]ETN11142.1 hypothetical protein PPTG_10109 [Phytophthora nicotianae INRA-310]KUG01169.1 hypothetical protein AM587_10015884 [Phytophthora nicotianae]